MTEHLQDKRRAGGEEKAEPGDVWLAAARALREAALAQDGVAALHGSAHFETRGRGKPVAGVALAGRRGGQATTARIGIVLGRAVLDDETPLETLTQALRTDLRRAWENGRGGEEPLQLELHLLDIAYRAADESGSEADEASAKANG